MGASSLNTVVSCYTPWALSRPCGTLFGQTRVKTRGPWTCVCDSQPPATKDSIVGHYCNSVCMQRSNQSLNSCNRSRLSLPSTTSFRYYCQSMLGHDFQVRLDAGITVCVMLPIVRRTPYGPLMNSPPSSDPTTDAVVLYLIGESNSAAIGNRPPGKDYVLQRLSHACLSQHAASSIKYARIYLRY